MDEAVGEVVLFQGANVELCISRVVFGQENLDYMVIIHKDYLFWEGQNKRLRPFLHPPLPRSAPRGGG